MSTQRNRTFLLTILLFTSHTLFGCGMPPQTNKTQRSNETKTDNKTKATPSTPQTKNPNQTTTTTEPDYRNICLNSIYHHQRCWFDGDEEMAKTYTRRMLASCDTISQETRNEIRNASKKGCFTDKTTCKCTEDGFDCGQECNYAMRKVVLEATNRYLGRDPNAGQNNNPPKPNPPKNDPPKKNPPPSNPPPSSNKKWLCNAMGMYSIPNDEGYPRYHTIEMSALHEDKDFAKAEATRKCSDHMQSMIAIRGGSIVTPCEPYDCE